MSVTGVALPGQWRLSAMRALFALTFIGLAPQVWTGLLCAESPWEPLPGVAMSFWGALSLLCLIGIFLPMQMLPLLALQMLYKATWLLSVGWPLYEGGALIGAARELAAANAIGVALDILVMPWGYLRRALALRLAQFARAASALR